jgi:citrate synthase
MSEGTLFVKDSRTSKEYEIPITRNSVKAADFKQIVGPAEGTNPADHVAKGLRLFDPGVQHTATHESKITWVYVLYPTIDKIREKANQFN